MKLAYLLVAGTALVATSALAADDKAKQGKSQGAQATSQEKSSGAGSSAQSGSGSGAGGSMQLSWSEETVKKVQEALTQQGYDPGPADGKVGPKTSAALKKAQTDKGIDATGKLDQQTMSALGVSDTGGAGGSGASSGSSGSGSSGSGSSGSGSSGSGSSGSSGTGASGSGSSGSGASTPGSSAPSSGSTEEKKQ